MSRRTPDAALSANLLDIVRHSPIAIAVFDRDMRYLVHSERYRDHYALGDQELVGRTHYEVFPDLPPRIREIHQRCLAGQGESGTADSLVRPDGRVEWANWDVRPWHTEDGAIGGIVVTTEVITARKTAEGALEEAHRRLAEAQRLARLGYWEWDLNSGVVTWSKEVYELFGVDPQTVPLSYDHYARAVPDEEKASVDERVKAAIKAGGPFQFDHAIVRPDGTRRYVVIDGRVVHDDQGAPTMLLGVAQDITTRRQLEEQLRESQKLEATGRLAGGIAHDLNNILTAIFSFSEFALAGLQTGHPAEGDIREVVRAADQAKALTQQLLAFSRRRTVIPRVVQINRRVQKVEAMMRRILGEDIHYATHLAADLWHTRIDPNALEQVIINLAVNARDAMPRGGRLTIETANVSLAHEKSGAKGQVIPAGDYVALMISDDGEGMTAEVKDHIFDPFYTTKAPGTGTGLGLSTCYGIVRQAEGFMWVYSEVGQGSTFKVYLPRVLDALDADVVPPAPKARGGSETILLAEDNDQVRRLTVRTLERLGYALIACDSAESALRALDDHAGPVHLLITDVIMPGLNGKELADRVEAARPGVRVLYISGYSENTIVHHGVLDAGVELLQKPFRPGDLAERVRQLLDLAPA